MGSELQERRAAVRAMLVEQVEATTPAPRGSSYSTRTRSGEPGRLRMAIVTGAVAVAVVAATLVALQLPHPAGGHVAAPAATEQAPAVTPTPTETPTRVLIAPVGWHERSRADLHTYVTESPIFQDDAANAAIWEEQAWLDIQCMATHGFLYDPIAQAESQTTAFTGLTAAQIADFEVAMYGPNTNKPYDWRTAGCHGRSVHVTGQDDAH